ncbi:MAG: RodZ domain-containing protein [Pseudomonadota bacterium]
MGSQHHPGLRGFDSYEVTLGDEMRGERASRGKSLLDVQRDLRIGADYIAAIENADASVFPFGGFAAGYIKSYARYLGMNPDDVFRRFCAESGFASPAASIEIDGRNPSAREAPGAEARRSAAAVDDRIISTRFIAANRKEASLSVVDGLRGLASVGMLAALVGGLGYGGWTMLQNLQRVGFAPLPTAPEVQVSAPDFFSPGTVADARPAPADVDGRVTLAALYATQEAPTPVSTPRDGPISSIDPSRAGIYAPPPGRASPPAGRADARAIVHDDGEVAGFGEVDPALSTAVERIERALLAAKAEKQAPAKAPPGVHVLAADEAWIRVRDGARRVLFSGTLGPGESFRLPEEAVGSVLRAGNAGGVYIVVDGEVFGPLGEGPAIAKNVSLTPSDVRATYPAAEGVAFAVEAEEETTADLALSSD